VIAVGVVLLLLARFVWRSPFFGVVRESDNPGRRQPLAHAIGRCSAVKAATIAAPSAALVAPVPESLI